MVAALKQTVTVQDGGRIEIRSSQLTPGTTADVIVLVEDNGQRPPDSSRMVERPNAMRRIDEIVGRGGVKVKHFTREELHERR